MASTRVCLEVHKHQVNCARSLDELLLEVPDEEVDQVGQLIKREMEAAADLAVPLIADIKAGPNWRDLTPYS